MFSEDHKPRGGILSRLKVASEGSKRYLGMASNEGKELVLRKGGEVDGCGDGVGMLEDGGGIQCSEEEEV